MAAPFGGTTMFGNEHETRWLSATDCFAKAQQHVHAARAINDEFEGQRMPADVALVMEGHLRSAQKYRLTGESKTIAEPVYKHDMVASGGPRIDTKGISFGGLADEGAPMTKST